MFTKAFRLFVSSTFKDFGEERSLLQRSVFPELESYCSARYFNFRAVDLRWGVNEEAQRDQRTAEICLEEVRAAKGYPAPNMLILLGERYGWVPLPFAVAQDEFEAAREWLRSQERDEVVAELDRIYQRDENHLIACGLRTQSGPHHTVAAYTLRPREGDLADLKDSDAWEEVVSLLREAFQSAAQHLHGIGLLDNSARDKYFVSLTEQEILTGFESSTTDASDSAAQTIAWIRTTSSGEQRVQALAASVRRALPDGSVLTTAEVPGHVGFGQDYRVAFVSALTRRLKAAVDRHIEMVEALTRGPDSALSTERATHQDFAAERLRVFVGRVNSRAAITAYIRGEARHPLILTGISGSGKSALMARAAADAEAVTSTKVVKRFVGASAASADQRALLVSIAEDLVALGVTQKPEQWEVDDNRFVGQVRNVLETIDQQVVIFVDALDQIRPPYRPGWLPDKLNGNVRLIVSTLDDEAFTAEREIVVGLRRNLPGASFVGIEPLTAADGRDILADLEKNARRRLQLAQRDFVIERFIDAGASPLYLSIAFAVARSWRSTDVPHARGLAGDVTSLLGQFIDELSSVHHHEPILVRRTLGLLAAGKDGLSESELIAVLSRDEAVLQAVSSKQFGADARGLPDSIWVRLRRHLAALLVEKGVDGEPVLNFFHRQVAEVVRTQIYEVERTALHQALATFFDAPVNMEGDAQPLSRRRLSELPYQLFHAQDRKRLDQILTDAAWIDRKIQAFGGVARIVEDYDSFADPADPLQPLIGRTLRLTSSILARDPRQRMPQLHGRLMGAGAGAQRDHFLAALLERASDSALIETRPAMTPPGAEVARLEGHSGGVNALAVLPDGRLASGAGDKSIRLWDPQSGRELARLEGHSDRVTALAALPDGRLASGPDDASGRTDSSIRLWDPQSGRELARLEGHSYGVNALAVLPDGRLASGAGDMSVRLWDMQSGRALARLEGHKGRVLALAVLPDGHLASGADDTSIRLWDPQSGRELARLDGHFDHVNALAVLPDGRLASGAGDNSVRLWDPESGRELARLEGHSGWVYALAVLPDGRLASGAGDNSIRLWDPQSGRELARLEGHSGWVNALAVMTDGRLASGAGDKSIRLWDPQSGRELTRPDGRSGAIGALAVLPDGRLASGAFYDSRVGSGGGTGDSSIRLWDPQSGRELARLEGHGFGVGALAALPDGRLGQRRAGRCTAQRYPAVGPPERARTRPPPRP